MRKVIPALVGLRGTTLLDRERELLRRLRPAGVLLLDRNVDGPEQLARLCAEVQELVGEPGRPALIAADQEGGAVSVLAEAVGRPPSAAALGLVDDPTLTEEVYRASAERARRVGVNFLLAPVADVDRPGNPVIGVRSFGRDSRRVARHVGAAVRGLRSGGVLSCAKHWPGHGATGVDSHLAATVVDLERRRWEEVDRPPFVEAVREGVDTLMVGHLSFPALDPSGRIAPLSTAMLEAARGGLPFTGHLVSDALEMEGFQGTPAQALRAGVQLLIFSAPVEEVAGGLEVLDPVDAESLPQVPPAPATGPMVEDGVSPGAPEVPRPAGRADAPGRPDADDPSWVRARREGLVLSGGTVPFLGEWVLLDGASGDRLFPLSRWDLAGGEGLAEALSRALGRRPRRVLRWDPHQAFTAGSAELEERLAGGGRGGVVYAGLRPPPEALEFFLQVALGPVFSWSVSLGLEPEALAESRQPRLWVPGLSGADVELVGGILGGRR